MATRPITGVQADDAGRCAHWNGPSDVVAFRFPCCDTWWACRNCHDAQAGHAAAPIPRQVQHARSSVLCGACYTRFHAHAYLARREEACEACGHAWNPACRGHEGRYFAPAGLTPDAEG